MTNRLSQLGLLAALLAAASPVAAGEVVLYDSGDLTRYQNGTPITALGMAYNGDETTSRTTAVFDGRIVSAISADRGERRADMVVEPLPGPFFENGNHAKVGVDLVYEITSYLPPDWKPDHQLGELFWQWHGIPDFDLGEDWRNPIVALYFSGDRIELSRRADSRALHLPRDSNDYEEFEVIDLGKADVGREVSWRFEVKWSYDYADPGYMRLYKDGDLLVARDDIITTFNDEAGRYMIFGLYKWDWPDRVGRVRSREMQFKDVRILAPAEG